MATVTSGALERVEAGLTSLFRWGNRPRVREPLVARAGIRLDRPLYGILGRLAAAGPQRLSDLAAHLGVDLSTVSRQVSQLQARDLVARTADPDDGRAARIALTEAGSELLARLRAARIENLARVLEDWPPEDVAALGAMLDRFVGDLSERWG